MAFGSPPNGCVGAYVNAADEGEQDESVTGRWRDGERVDGGWTRGREGYSRVTRDGLKISNDNGPKTDRCPMRTAEKRPVKTFTPPI
ncbi:hypothetical protein QTP88_002376 [Uroleucon formosanum]